MFMECILQHVAYVLAPQEIPWVILSFQNSHEIHHKLSQYIYDSLLYIQDTEFFFNWSVVDLQCSVNFCCPAKWFSYESVINKIQL